MTNSEGNHGEDVKEYYFYLDSTPTHSYMKYLYKYPQEAFPYAEIVETNKKRTKFEQEFELLDTKVFDDNKYFDVFVEYAKADVEDILVRITLANRGAGEAVLHVLPTLWFRNTWFREKAPVVPELRQASGDKGTAVVRGSQADLGEIFLRCEGAAELLFTNNETNEKRLYGGPNPSPYVKDGFHEYIVHGVKEAVNPQGTGTKAAAHYEVKVPAQGEVVLKLRLTRAADVKGGGVGADFDRVFSDRIGEADGFYEGIFPPKSDAEDKRIMRQALAGMLWSKQFYYFDLDVWLKEHGYNPTGDKQKKDLRNAPWYHMINEDIISMPDKWEYPSWLDRNPESLRGHVCSRRYSRA
jgi:hypothetical protein